MINLWSDPIYAKKQSLAQGRKFNKAEQLLFNAAINLECPNEYKYSGDCSFIIGSKNPDFVNENKKKVIELFGDYWHNPAKFPNKKIQSPQERIDYFKQYGWDCLVIWEHELKDMNQVRLKAGIWLCL